MNYIWEVLLQAMKEEVPEEWIAFVHANRPSPYLEAAFEDLNPKELGETVVAVNAFYRFGDALQALLDGRLADSSHIRRWLFDILMHFLGELDLLDGMSRQEYYACFLRRDIENGRYGQHNKEVLRLFNFEKRRHVQEHMVHLYQNGPSVYLLRSLLRSIYASSMLYLDSTDRRELLVYIGHKKTPALQQQVDFLLELFVPLGHTIHLFWELHFGIISVNETMLIDEIMIY